MGLLQLFDLAGPALNMAMLIALLILLWSVSVLNQRLQVTESRIDSLERELQQVDEELEILAKNPLHKETETLDDESSIIELLGTRSQIDVDDL